MKLDTDFVKFPLSFDVEQLRQEISQFTESDWRPHPQGYEGNSALILISRDGGQNDDMAGHMKPTPNLGRCPYIRQVLNTFQSVFGRSRLMRLGPGASVGEHSDINYHWYYRVRIHVPIITFPEVKFYCGKSNVHMAAGEAWTFNSWEMHNVVNPTNESRIHLVADTTGSPAFWKMAGNAQHADNNGTDPLPVPFDPETVAAVKTEIYNSPVVMSPGEIDALLLDLCSDVEANQDLNPHAVYKFTCILEEFRQAWRTTWSEFGQKPDGWPGYRTILERISGQVRSIQYPLVLASNSTNAFEVLNARVLLHALNPEAT